MLEILAESTTPPSIVELASALKVHRSIAYRILRTLEDHGLVSRSPSGHVRLGARMAALARNVSRDLQSAALPELTSVANELGITAFLAVLDQTEVVTLVSVEPRHAHATVAQRPGSRHPLAVGAPGIAILSAFTPAQLRILTGTYPVRSEVAEAAKRGFATSHDEVIRGLSSVAVPLVVSGQPPAAVAVVFIASSEQVGYIASHLADAASAIKHELE